MTYALVSTQWLWCIKRNRDVACECVKVEKRRNITSTLGGNCAHIESGLRVSVAVVRR